MCTCNFVCHYSHLGTQAQLQELQEKPDSGELETPEIGSKEKHTGKPKRGKKRKIKDAQPPAQVYTCTIIITLEALW